MTPDLDRPTIGALMTRERRWSQLHRVDDRLERQAAAAEAWPPDTRAYQESPEPLPAEPAEDVVLTEDDVRRIVHEELAGVLEVIGR